MDARTFRLADVNVANNDTLTIDPQLQLVLPEGWHFLELLLMVTSPAAAGFRYAIEVDGDRLELEGGVTEQPITTDGTAQQPIRLSGTLEIPTGGGTLSLLWCQDTADAGTTTLHEGSVLEASSTAP